MEKKQLMELILRKGIDSRPFFYPLSSLLAYEGSEQAQLAPERNQVSYAISPYGVNLPSALNMTKDKIQYVCNVLIKILYRGR